MSSFIVTYQNIVNKKGNSNISVYEYSYYLDGSDACKTRNENGIIEKTEYKYDGLKRLTEESVKVGNSTDTYAYEYDDYGNRAKMIATGSENYVTEYSYNNAQGNYTALLQKEVKTVEGEENPLDLTSNVKQTVYTYDANGNQIKKTAEGKTETNTYDGLNQLIGFTDGETTASYKYNASGLRYEKTVDGETINHVWDGSKQIVADVIDNQFYEADCYIRGTNLVAKYNFCNGTRSEYTYYTQNAHGDVVNLTNTDGEVTKKYTYDAFGVEKNIDDSDTNAFRYCGEYYDAETGTIYLRARYYNPTTGRFISRDSYAGKNEDPLSLNRYTYCHNNPLIFVDLDGHKTYDLGKGWEARIESSHGNNNDKGQHVHLSYKDGKKTYSQNDDGSPHDKNNNSSGSPPAKVLKKLKEKTGWDWNKNEENFLNKAEYDYCGTISKPYYQVYAVYQVTYADETIRFAYESPFNEFSPSTDRLKDIYKDGMTSNPIKGEQNTGTSSVIICPMPYSGPITFPSFGFFPFPAFGF